MTAAGNKIPLGQFIARMAMTAVIFPSVIPLAAGNWRWLEGWIFALWFDPMVLFNVIYLYWKDPELLAERSKAPGSENQKRWAIAGPAECR